MHPSVMEFVKAKVEHYGLADQRVLEVGSLDVNGTVRDLFTGPYHGTDMRPGPGVDEVVSAHALTYDTEFDAVVCTEMLEHDTLPWLSLAAMWRACQPAGMLLLSCRGFDERGAFPLHEHPDDIYRFTVTGIRHLLEHSRWRPIEVIPDPECPGVLAVAQR